MVNFVPDGCNNCHGLLGRVLDRDTSLYSSCWSTLCAMLLAISSWSKRDSADHSRLDRNE